MRCLVVYDIPDDAARTKVADACLDYGLARIQYSAFMGDLSPNYQEELFLKIRRQVGGRAANVQLFPICDRDIRRRRVLAIAASGATTKAARPLAPPGLPAPPPNVQARHGVGQAPSQPLHQAKRAGSAGPQRRSRKTSRPPARDLEFAGREA